MTTFALGFAPFSFRARSSGHVEFDGEPGARRGSAPTLTAIVNAAMIGAVFTAIALPGALLEDFQRNRAFAQQREFGGEPLADALDAGARRGGNGGGKVNVVLRAVLLKPLDYSRAMLFVGNLH